MRNMATEVVILSHTVRQIHKCVMEQADHTCFLYTLKPNDKEQAAIPGAPGYVFASDPNQLVPANISDQNYQCHLMQASDEQHVSLQAFVYGHHLLGSFDAYLTEATRPQCLGLC